jgi:hypothetical protein
MALCDKLEAAIEMSKTTQEKWMESSLRDVFEGEVKRNVEYFPIKKLYIYSLSEKKGSIPFYKSFCLNFTNRVILLD